MRKQKMQNRSEETHNRIIATAQKLFAQAGYDAVGVAEICAAADVSKGAFYHHFHSKQALFIAIFNDWLSELNQNMKASLETTSKKPEELVNFVPLAYDLFKVLGKSQVAILFEFWIQATRHPEIHQAAIAPYHYYQTQFSAFIQKGVEENSFSPDINPDTASRTLIALAMGLLLQAFFDPNGTDWEKNIRDSIEILIKGFYRRSI